MALSDSNPDFRHKPDMRALTHSHDTGWPEWLQRIVEGAVDRDRQLEDYLNRHVIRRRRAVSEAGDGAAVTTTGWATFAVAGVPSLTRTFLKASSNSNLIVTVGGSALIGAGAPPAWADFGVLEDATATDNFVCRLRGDNAAGSQAGWGEVEIAGLPKGLITLTLRGRVDAAGTTITLAGGSSQSIGVTESHQ